MSNRKLSVQSRRWRLHLYMSKLPSRVSFCIYFWGIWIGKNRMTDRTLPESCSKFEPARHLKQNSQALNNTLMIMVSTCQFILKESTCDSNLTFSRVCNFITVPSCQNFSETTYSTQNPFIKRKYKYNECILLKKHWEMIISRYCGPSK